MLFNSLHFIVFFVFVTTTYYTLAGRWRWILLLTASAYFYASFIPAYLLLLGVIIVFDYLAGIGIEMLSGKLRKAMLVASILANLGFLCFFKYFHFLNENIAALLGFAGMGSLPSSGWGLALPIGHFTRSNR